jgi:hypothetical protein
VERSGQSTCTDEAGLVVECGGTGQDGDLRKGIIHPDPRFTDTGDGTITDNLTGLVWLKDANCSGAMTWQASLDWANRLADGCTDCGGLDDDCGLSDGSQPGDWRLTNINELRSLVHLEYFDPAIPSTSGDDRWSEGDPFSNVLPFYYFTSTSAIASPSEALFIDLFNGTESWAGKGAQHFAWAVRADVPGGGVAAPAPVEATGQSTCFDTGGAQISCADTGQDGDHQAGVPLPSPRFTDNLDGTISDNLTGLVWLMDAHCYGSTTWQSGLDWARRLADGCPDCGGVGGDCGLSDISRPGAWRLANIKELQSLVHFGYQDPPLSNASGDGHHADGDPFTHVQVDQYFSSTSYMDNPVWALHTVFSHGTSDVIDKTGIAPLWAVRGGPIFTDSFESGDTSAWSGTVP